MAVRRVVTGQNSEGRSVIVEDDVVEPVMPDLAPGFEFHRIWGHDEPPMVPNDGSPPKIDTYLPPADGNRFVSFTIPPGKIAMRHKVDLSEALEELDRCLPGLAEHIEWDTPGRLRTDSIGYL